MVKAVYLLGDVAERGATMIEIRCGRCDRYGRLSVARLLAEYARKLAELDLLLNDPDVPMQPARVWTLLAETARFKADMESFPHAGPEPETEEPRHTAIPTRGPTELSATV